MEPGHEDREYMQLDKESVARITPQWSPVMKTGNTLSGLVRHRKNPRGLNGARS